MVCSNRKLILILFYIGLFVLVLFSNYNVAFNLYSSGMEEYRRGNYDLAIEYLEKSIESSHLIEANFPNVKLYIGLSAFYLDDFSKSKYYLNLFPDNKLAQNVLQIIENYDFEDTFSPGVIIREEILEQEIIDEGNNILAFSIITVVIFVIALLTAFVTIFILRFLGIGFGVSSVKVKEKNEVLKIPEEKEENISEVPNINLEEVENLKLENLENVMSQSKALKKLLGEIEGEETNDFSDIEEISDENEENIQNDEKKEKTDELLDMIDESMKDASLDDLESILNEMEEGKKSKSESKQDVKEEKINNEDEILSKNEEINEDNVNADQEIEINENLEKTEKDIKEIEGSIKADNNLKNRFNKIMNEEEIFINQEAEHANDLLSLVDEIEREIADKKTKEYSKKQLNNFFNTLFFDINEKVENK